MMARSPSPAFSLDEREHGYDLSANFLHSTHSRPSTLRNPSIDSERHRDGLTADTPSQNHSSRLLTDGLSDNNGEEARFKNGTAETTRITTPIPPASDSLLAEKESREHPSPTWLPLTLKNSFLGLLSCLALALCVVIIALLIRSQTNYGLGPDDGSAGLLFGWRFSPTLIAVIYIQLTAMLVDDVKRLEPFARLARSGGSGASSSILQTTGAWWTALHDGLSKKKNDGRSRSWVLFCATLVNVLGFLLISPLSSALLVSDDVAVPREMDFLRLTPQFDASLPLTEDRTAHFRTISHFAQNVTTSPWITDDWTMLPFWPADWESLSLGYLPSASQEWTVGTTVFRSNLVCNKLKMTDINSTVRNQGNKYNNANYTYLFSTWSSDGCELGLDVQMDHNSQVMFTMGGASWSNASAISIGQDTMTGNGTSACKDREFLLISEPWEGKVTTNMNLCRTTYYMANVTATVDLSGSEPQISFNETEYDANRQEIPDSFFDTKTMRDRTLGADWTTYMQTLDYVETSWLSGPSVLLWLLYNNNLTAMAVDENVVSRATEIEQRFLGEMLQSSMAERGVSQYLSVAGRMRNVERRVTATAGPAITLIILLFLSFTLLLIVWICSRPQRRPLNLNSDPASSAGVTSLVTNDPRTRFGFKDLDQASNKELQTLLKDKHYYTDTSALHEMDSDQPENEALRKPQPMSAEKSNWTPGVLRLPSLLGLILCLVAVLVGVVVLYHFARTSKLYEQAFIYQASITIFDKRVSTIGPFSIIPTVIAVGIGLWWGLIDSNFCRLQPFLAMAKRHRPLSQSVYISYQSSYWMWATIKTAMNRHWMLFWVTLGTAISPIFTTAMSAIFEHQSGIITNSQILERSLEIRQIPNIFETQDYTVRDANTWVASIMSQLHGNLSSHWIYTATNQLTLSGSEPAWSKDGWSFAPLDLGNVSLELPNGSSSNDDSDGINQGSRINVTFSTPALRGRMECSPYEGLTNLSAWLTPVDVSNTSVWTFSSDMGDIKTGFELGVGYQYNSDIPSMMFPLEPSRDIGNCTHCTPIFANPGSIKCCRNGTSTDTEPMVAVGYWSPNGNPVVWNPRTWERNFTTKWIYGHAQSAASHPDGIVSEQHLIFTEIPSITAINCAPLIESANAQVTVDPTNGDIRSFDILDDPQEVDNAFTDNFLAHNTTNRVQALVTYNSTVSYGALFMTQMLTAANVKKLEGATRVGGWTYEDLSDNTFNIRDEANGLNMDFMTYSMYYMAGKDPKALLNLTTYERLASKTFTTFFQHFASNNISMETGGWAYQPINASLPSDLAPAVNNVTKPYQWISLADQQDELHPTSNINRTAVVTVDKRVELLQMNAVAVWISVGILSWLIIASFIVAIFHRHYLQRLVRNVECLGDILVMVAGSENLVRAVQEIQAGRLAETEKDRLHARLGWFEDGHGKARWGVEMVEGSLARTPVQWLPDGYGKSHNLNGSEDDNPVRNVS
ncbi:hypothetical protein BDV25DRAFT_153274 [Aspergillus avenaceus]|uniref:Uncharacterized protein n=1 Tax=Aspergillus avenaceus TaxID=36643 RepID=A0A5N6TXC9_ASPAV|nr:hypothetical protein BDV25DRAFT_153274 [Aspergillus avenaceus]